ncbi:MAG: hypothetical protein WKF55_13075 [Gemmatimonadaceae bacterium]
MDISIDKRCCVVRFATGQCFPNRENQLRLESLGKNLLALVLDPIDISIIGTVNSAVSAGDSLASRFDIRRGSEGLISGRRLSDAFVHRLVAAIRVTVGFAGAT